MKARVMYIELKSGYSDDGPAWIGKVEFSKSGQTIYFDNKALKKMKTRGVGNHYDLETGEEYWVSGVKKNGQDRHRSGKGKIMLDKKSIDEIENDGREHNYHRHSLSFGMYPQRENQAAVNIMRAKQSGQHHHW